MSSGWHVEPDSTDKRSHLQIQYKALKNFRCLLLIYFNWISFLFSPFFNPDPSISNTISPRSPHQSVLSIQGGSSPSSAFTTSARWTRWRRSVGPCTSAWWPPASPPRERASSPCSSGRPSEGLCSHCWTTTTGAALSSSTTQTEVNSYFISKSCWYRIKMTPLHPRLIKIQWIQLRLVAP